MKLVPVNEESINEESQLINVLENHNFLNPKQNFFFLRNLFLIGFIYLSMCSILIYMLAFFTESLKVFGGCFWGYKIHT